MQIDLNIFANECDCGRAHTIFVKDIIIEAGAIHKLPELLKKIYDGKYEDISIICDTNTYVAAGKVVEEMIHGCKVVMLPYEGLHADNHAVSLTETCMRDNTKLILAVGSGTIHDISRYLANRKGIPFVSIPTAASVDGFVSTVAAMTWNGFKKTFPAVSPIMVIADSDIFSKAPYRLTASGISDLLGKYTALADWKIAHLVTNEYICDKVCNLELQAVQSVCDCISDLRSNVSREKQLAAYEQLMYALLLSGLAMQMVGNSRPASGAEHHISHLWEMEVINSHIDAYHGEKVSVGLMIAIQKYHKVKNAILTGNYRMKQYEGLENTILQETFGAKGLYDGILDENTPDPLEQVDIHKLEELLPAIANIIEQLPPEDYIYNLLSEAGCIKSVQEVGLSDSIIPLTVSLAPYVRNRLTFMRLIKLIELY